MLSLMAFSAWLVDDQAPAWVPSVIRSAGWIPSTKPRNPPTTEIMKKPTTPRTVPATVLDLVTPA
jgi:hypothetical protein